MRRSETSEERRASVRHRAWRLSCGIGAAALTSLAAPTAAGAEPPPPPAPPPSASAQAPRPPGTVRLNVRPWKTKEDVRLHVGNADGGWAFVCRAPCTADVVPGTALRVTLGDSEEGHEFAMEGNPGNDVDLDVRPASKGPLAGGIVMVSIGGLTALIGIALSAVALAPGADDDLGTAGLVCLAAGGGLTLGGILIIAKRSHEPRVRQDQHAPSQEPRPITQWSPPLVPERGPDLYTRDVATRGPVPSPTPAFTPLGFSVRF